MKKEMNRKSNSRLQLVIKNKFLPNCKRSTSRFDFDISHKFFTKSKRSQITIFIILTIVILAVALIFYTIKTKSSSENKEYDDNEINQINQLINDCVEQRAIDAIYLVGLQGGYVRLPDEYIETELSNSFMWGVENG